MWYKIALVVCLILAVIVTVEVAKNKEAYNKAYWQLNTEESISSGRYPSNADYHKLAEWNIPWTAWLPEGFVVGIISFIVLVILVSVVKIALKK